MNGPLTLVKEAGFKKAPFAASIYYLDPSISVRDT